jgi:hypothetical protein
VGNAPDAAFYRPVPAWFTRRVFLHLIVRFSSWFVHQADYLKIALAAPSHAWPLALLEEKDGTGHERCRGRLENRYSSDVGGKCVFRGRCLRWIKSARCQKNCLRKQTMGARDEQRERLYREAGEQFARRLRGVGDLKA